MARKKPQDDETVIFEMMRRLGLEQFLMVVAKLYPNDTVTKDAVETATFLRDQMRSSYERNKVASVLPPM